ncbi:alpha-2-macroglobulin-like, partial [Discoglossus pictus]
MYLTKILLSVSFLCLTDGWKKSEPQYALITPVQLKGGQHEMMVLHLQGHEEPLNYTAVLQVNGENHTIMEGTAEPNSHYESKSFTVPTMNETTPVNLILTATGENTEIMQSSVVAITKIIPYITYVQTSKPVYQPGETVHGSMFSLNSLGMPLVMSYPSISINDPNGISLMAWLNVPAAIVTDIQADLDFDAQTGQYSVVVRNGEDLIVQTTFEVAPIELPRYFMTVNTPSTLSVMERTMMIGVSVSYIYEEAVPGSVLIRCCRPLAYLYGTRANCYKGKEDICTDIIGQLDAYGNYQTHIDLDQFSKGGSEYQMALTLDIVVTEDGSGEQSREYRYVSITAALANVYLRDPKEHYKPGMPFILEVRHNDGPSVFIFRL